MARDVTSTEPPSAAPEVIALLRLALRRAGLPAADITSLAWEEMPASYSNARLARVRLTVQTTGSASAWHTSLIVKQIEAGEGWLAWATQDLRVREVQLWRTGIFERLPHGVTSAALIAEQRLAQDGSVHGGTLVMRDMRAHLLPAPHLAPHHNALLLRMLLDALARLHAAFWKDPALLDPHLGLVPPDAALGFAAPDTVATRLAMGDPTPYLHGMLAAWETYLVEIPQRASVTLRAALADRTPFVAAIGELPHTLIHGDTWGPNIGTVGAYDGQRHLRMTPGVVLLDWGLASNAPCTYDPLWLAATWPALNPVRVMALYRARLMLHLQSRGVRLTEAAWLRLLDAGYLRTVLAGGEAFGRALLQAETRTQHTRVLSIASWWATRAASAADRLLAH